MTGTGAQRLHYLDHLRAHMMLLGIVFHCALGYTHIEAGRWTYVEPASHYVLDTICAALHSFRMPAFFIVAGFFATLLLQRRSTRYFVRDRSLRILLPLALLALPNDLLIQTIDAWSGPLSIHGATESTGFNWRHLWFLYFLVLFYSLHLVVRAVSQALGWEFSSRVREWPVTRLALPFGVVMGLAVYSHGTLRVGAPNQLWPDGGHFLLFLCCYALGATLYRHHGLSGQRPDLLNVRNAAGWWLGWSLFYAVATSVVLTPEQIGSKGFNPVSALGQGMVKLYTAVLLIALYQRFLQQESAMARYLSDSSYWLYLMHFPLSIGLPPLLHEWAVAPTLKFAVVLTTTVALGLLTYEWLVRDTVLGTILNGKRNPRVRRVPVTA